MPTILGNEYSVSNAFTGTHPVGTHYHSDDAATSPAIPGEWIEVGGFFGDEVCKGMCFFDLSGLSGQMLATATLQIETADLTALIGDCVGGLYGQTQSQETIELVAFDSDGNENLGDYTAAQVGAQIGTLDASAETEGDTNQFNVLGQMQQLITAGATHMGIRFQQTTGDSDSGAITFINSQIEYTVEPDPKDVYVGSGDPSQEVEIVCWKAAT